MKTVRTTTLLAHLTLSARARALTLAIAGAAPLAPAGALVAGSLAVTSIAGCADENDPKTWVKRLDDPGQRSAAIKRLGSFFDDGLSKANKNRDAPEIKALLDDIVPALTKTYVSVTLDEKTRKDLMKLLADTRDPRTAPALAKAFNEYEAGSTDDDVKFAAQSMIGQATAGTLTDQSAIDGLWACFAKFQPSKVKSINLVTDLHDAVLAVKHPSYGPKAVAKLAAPVDPTVPAQSLDQIQFWQRTAIQVIGELRYAPAAKAVVTVVLTPTKSDLRATANAALLRIPAAAETALLGAFTGSDPDLAKLAPLFTDKSFQVVAADSLSWLSRPAGKAAILDAITKADSDQNRALLALSLGHYPPTPDVVKAFLDAYAKVPANTTLALMNDANAHGLLAQLAAQFYDPKMTDWLLKEVSSAKGPEAYDVPFPALDSAIKLMQPSQVAKVGEAVKNAKVSEPEKKLSQEKFNLASAVVAKCKENPTCYVEALAQPVPSTPPSAAETAVKAAWMAVEYGATAAGVKNALVDKLPLVKHAGARLALVEAIDALAPTGDTSAADKLDKLVAADKATGDRNLIAGDDGVVKVAARLRARAMP